jgi:hypothetical protein
MTEHEQNLRDLAAMFAMAGLIIRNREGDDLIPMALDLADDFIKARSPTQDGGIADITPKRKYGRKTVD